MILVVGGIADRVTEFMCARLEERGCPYRLLDQGVYPSNFQIWWEWDGDYPAGWIEGPDWHLDLADITSVYARYLGAEGRVAIEGLGEEEMPAIWAECDAGLIALFEHLPCRVVNRVAGGSSNNTKPYQGLLLRQTTLLPPPTLVTSDPDAARAFYQEHAGEVIYKSLSGIRSIVRRMGPEQLERLPYLRYGPAQLQACIPGDNVRVHTVGGQAFATRVRSDAIDYRYGPREGHDVEMEPADLPAHIVESCLQVARKLDLLFAGIDLIETPDGEYYCLEINPSPAFLYYELGTGQPISVALADLLHGVTDSEERGGPMA
jgi:hypothetical protein